MNRGRECRGGRHKHTHPHPHTHQVFDLDQEMVNKIAYGVTLQVNRRQQRAAWEGFHTLTNKRLYLFTYPFKKQEVWDLISLWWKTLPTVSQQGANPQQVCVFF